VRIVHANIFKEGLRFLKAKEAEGFRSSRLHGKRLTIFFKKRREIAQYHEGLLEGDVFEYRRGGGRDHQDLQNEDMIDLPPLQ